ncbi:hypothetical protein BBOV_II001440 [Babesia bovis T2Bo]|uniref:hypothetical protein n=1 Tax=Babesia bovis T2Bo TaxID=484906 RepID=UPI001C365D09|nr:hypothetical protein BBOV_II001440 [Babesia bovis T2Bo]EDO06102.2 hypothetical protein BBOV_II001440 [Babesia bovis T2Bo]
MGGRKKARHKGIGKKRNLKRGIRDLKHRTKDIDQVYESLAKDDMELEHDVQASQGEINAPYCKYCDRHFIDNVSMERHKREKPHKKRVKELYTHQPME